VRVGVRILLGALALSAVMVSSAVAAPTRAEYIAQADPICQTTNERGVRAIRGQAKDVTSGRYKQAARKHVRLIRIFAAGVSQLAVLQPPDADAALIGSWIQSLQAQIPLAKRITKPLARGHIPKASRILKRLTRLSDETKAMIRDYGFQFCDET
jgi:hypothetical protein